MLTSAQVRQLFLDFFLSKSHTIVPSSPIVVKNDPTLLFTNAGMNQFKDYFLGNKLAVNKRVADTQKCLRVSGKHNDLEEVGVDTYHHTMFEMLGNWSFGDYFKAEAIAWSWELLTEVYKIPKDRLYVTIFEGDEKEGIPKDEEAYTEWLKWIPADRILLGNKKDNFWEMGDTGPCGPCTEIHVDCRNDAERAALAGSGLVNNDHPQVIEIWNNVFIQFNRLKDGSLQLLPAKHVDTGMGFERLVRVIQGKSSNYDTDVFMPTITLLETITGKKYQFADTKQDIAFRVLADHIRAIACTIADGQLPSNNGAGYVIRRILRRAVRYYYSYLDFKAPLLYRLLPLIANQFSAVFPEINQQADFITKVIKEEEEAFLRTLEKGLKRIDDILQATQHNKELVINGKAVFELLDTYGFPLDLTKLIAAENGLSIDEAGFEQEMLQQKNRSRAASAIDTDDWIVLQPDGGKGFVGYNDILVETAVTRYRKVKLKGKESFQLVLQETPFYAESGGQVGDKGSLRFGDEVIEVTDTKKENNVTVHFTDKLPANINSNLIAAIDVEKRLYTTYNHTATHLLHAALRQVLGTHVAQKGSLVNEQNLRFDFSHFAKLSDDEIRQVELIVNEKIRENIPVVIKQMSKEAALEMGAMALFGEKYADEVRVVIIDPNYSIELCGGTHVMSTGMIGTFKIITETAVAAGVRRIEALTGSAAFNYLYDQFVSLKEIAGLLKTKDAVKAVEKILQDKAQLEKKVESLEAKQIAFMEKQLIEKSLVINGINFLGEVVEVGSSDQLKKLALQLKASLNNGLVVLTASIDGKAAVVIATDEQSGKDAGLLIKQVVAPLIKGGGGGNKILATAGGVDASNLSQIIANIKINL